MFIGHYASGLIFYKLADRDNLMHKKSIFFLMVVGTQFVDLLWGIFILMGIEGGLSGGSVEYNYFDVPWSHSLLMMVLWSFLYGIGSYLYFNSKIDSSKLISFLAGFSVLSHWFLDFIVHNDDMLLLPNSDIVIPTLYLWKYPIATFLLELAIIILCWFIYFQHIQKNEATEGSKLPIIMIGILILFHVINFLPTINDAPAMEANGYLGIFVMFGILLIGYLMTRFHLVNVVNNE